MKTKSFFADCKTRYLALLTVLTLLFTLGSGNVWGETATLTITRDDFSGSGGYAWYSWTDGDFSGQAYIYATTTTSMQFNGGKSGRTIFNSTPLPGRIVSIKMTKASGTDRAWVVRGGTTANGAPTTSSTNTYGTAIGGSQSVGTKTWSTTDGTDYRYFLLYENVTSASYISEIVITYEVPASCGVPSSLTKGAVVSSTQPVSWSAPSSAPANGYLVAVGTTSSAPADNVQINNGAAYTWGDHFVSHVAAGTTSFTFSTSQGVVEGTEYHWWVRSKCGASDYSSWVAGTAFTIPSSCANNVTINKGTSTNCSFTLSPSGAQESCDGVTTTVSITPTTGYGNPSVTQSGASKTPTITGSGTSWTVTYPANTTGTSVINVSCSANNYTITLNTDLTPTSAGTTSITATYNANTNLTSAITKPTKTGWTFGGYFTAKNGGGTQIIDASGNVIASVSGYTDASRNWKHAGNITLYAKWTCTVTWSVNGLTNVYSTQTVTYNSSGSKVASVPTPDPASYCGDIFAGWSRKNAGAESKTTSYYDDLFKTVGDSPDIKNIGDITFYAVFADEE